MHTEVPGRALPLVSVVDDDRSIRESLPELLKAYGYAVRAFASAEEFLASDCVDQTNCLILDINMPGMSGPELQAELAHSGRGGIPIIFITAAVDRAVRARVLAAQAVDFLYKPFTEDALLKALDAALGAR
ncbi:MAG: response regulator [Betaproteobacteria bacterium]